LEAELNLDPDSNPNPNPESDPELITDPDPKLQIILDPAGSGSGCTTLLTRILFSEKDINELVVSQDVLDFLKNC
jgi:hypothetical protein